MSNCMCGPIWKLQYLMHKRENSVLMTIPLLVHQLNHTSVTISKNIPYTLELKNLESIKLTLLKKPFFSLENNIPLLDMPEEVSHLMQSGSCPFSGCSSS